jgi:hypothetical protein
MNPVLILHPMAALAALTFLVVLLVGFTRFRAGGRRLITADDFRFGESPKVPGHVSIPNRNLMNLLEVPMLFYIGCLTLYVTKTVDQAPLYLAWTYVALRVIHSAIHLSYNNVYHRLSVYTVSNVVLVTLWVVLFAALARQAG